MNSDIFSYFFFKMNIQQVRFYEFLDILNAIFKLKFELKSLCMREVSGRVSPAKF